MHHFNPFFQITNKCICGVYFIIHLDNYHIPFIQVSIWLVIRFLQKLFYFFLNCFLTSGIRSSISFNFSRLNSVFGKIISSIILTPFNIRFYQIVLCSFIHIDTLTCQLCFLSFSLNTNNSKKLRASFLLIF